ncbi:winged helix-turn-helix domain-containing protein [Enterobacter roggenkampii]|uniref:OmpR/PhoB-type domain-containing protein n=2 Tax=Enterobacter roggenkampii TaxID=1812935 RepID=A0AAU9C1F4_9ENTR|nr:winged helix-turn-helix domain-containing protein [Enterobacter roggenkampii]QLU35402.1 winged helix-turn-helix transcriptional regulator [Enterobacter cloacae]KJO37654.1 transcriptional regulator [Enterobacter roggenkampii]MBG0660414.1 winged helix-turn-helix transcriptional regulator [Enterobacter roggenkampii]MBG0696485.1 winged helix-turn-helix transcriptional regulator [Enterobacter roggenkampii]MBT1891061.1 winged helix-turn-helix domain-containing protein [Enterobacter roggenkampii]
MVFVIDNRVFYRSEDGAIWPSGDEGSTVILTLTMNRLLACLLEKHGQVLTRNELLESVWDAHGLRSSSHTLNKYISELRKHFVQLGIVEECITTVPRVGFMFNSDVEVRVLTQPTIGDESRLEVKKNDAQLVKERSPVRVKYRKLPIALALAVVLISAILIMLGLRVPSKDLTQVRELKTYFLFNYGSCPVYTVQRNSASLSEQKKELFIELAKGSGINCLEGTSFLYQVSESYLYGNKGRAFISRCTARNDKYISCLNNYWNGYERTH